MGTMWVRQAGGKGCLKSRGPFQLLEKSATSGCATFKILGKEFRSVDEPGYCLDYFDGRGWGLWGCHKGQNQQFLQTGSKWCIAGGHCVESAPTTITTSTTRAATTVVTTTTTTTITVITMWVRGAGGKGCLKSRGPFQLLEKSATSGCATFKILGKEFRSVDEPGHCLDYFHGRGWGLWGCHKGQNQQFLQTGSKWCIAGGHCVESAPTTITTSTTRAATTVVTTTTTTTMTTTTATTTTLSATTKPLTTTTT